MLFTPRGLCRKVWQGAQSIRVVGGKGPPKISALWKSFKMPRGDPLIRLDPKMLIQFWCFGVFRVLFLTNPF